MYLPKSFPWQTSRNRLQLAEHKGERYDYDTPCTIFLNSV